MLLMRIQCKHCGNGPFSIGWGCTHLHNAGNLGSFHPNPGRDGVGRIDNGFVPRSWRFWFIVEESTVDIQNEVLRLTIEYEIYELVFTDEFPDYVGDSRTQAVFNDRSPEIIDRWSAE